MNLQILGSSLLRHGLTALGTLLVAKGITDAAGAATISNWAEGLTGGGMFLGGLAWSYIRNHFFNKAITK